MMPHTRDGRVLFAVPWHEFTLLGTTDTPLPSASLEPRALEKEVDFVLQTAGNYLTRMPSRSDILSVFAGLRPLAAPDKAASSTKEISRSHKLIVSDTGLITITGRSEEPTSELQSLMRISYAVFCLKKKKKEHIKQYKS